MCWEPSYREIEQERQRASFEVRLALLETHAPYRELEKVSSAAGLSRTDALRPCGPL